MPSFYSRVSLAVWFGILGLLLIVVVGGVWSALLITNLTISPAVPWSVFAMALILWFTWQYLGGKGPPRRTSEARRGYLRVGQVSVRVFAWTLLAGALSIVALTGFWIVLFQLVKAHGNTLPDFSKYPYLTVALALTMASVVGAVTEEASLRGYLQGVLEREFGGPAAIMITSLVIAPVHGLTQGFAWPTLLFYFIVDTMFGTTAYLTNSILPGIVIHAAGLLTFFTLIWPHDATRRIIADGGADGWFWLHAAQAILFSAMAILAFRHLAKIANHKHAKTMSRAAA